MRHIYFSVLVLILFFSCSPDVEIPCIPSKLANNVIAFYPFSVGNLSDKALNKFDLTSLGNSAVVKDRNGNERCAYRFNGQSDQYLFRNGDFLNNLKNKSYSVSLWYQPLLGKNDRQVLLAKGERGMTKCNSLLIEEWFIILHDCERVSYYMDGKCQWGDFPTLWQDSTIIDKCNAELMLYENTWHHLAVTYDNGMPTVFLDGIKSQNKLQDWGACVPVKENIGDIFIGKGFYGDIDDIIIFDKALTQTEVNQLFNLEACCI